MNFGSMFSTTWFSKFFTNENAKGNMWTVGDYRHSGLTESQFQELNGTDWVLANGQDVTGSRWHSITSSATVPDARGEFLRGLDNGRGVDSGRGLNTAQSDATAKNGLTASSSTIPSSGAHIHTNTSGHGTDGYYPNLATTASAYTTVNVNSSNSNHTHSAPSITIGAGDAETRPRNVAVNIFIKVN